MAAKLHLHVRTLPNKRVVVTPVPLNWCSRDGASYQEARTAAVAAVRERLSELSARSAASWPTTRSRRSTRFA